MLVKRVARFQKIVHFPLQCAVDTVVRYSSFIASEYLKMVNGNQKYADYLEPTRSTWKRPNGPPRVWRVVQGRKKMSNGEVPKFHIQEVPEKLKEDVIDYAVKYFIPEETTCVDQGKCCERKWKN